MTSPEEAAIGFQSADFQIERLDWTMDHRSPLTDQAYREFHALLQGTYPGAKVRVIVRHYYGQPKGVSIGAAAVRFKRNAYLGAQMLPPEELRAAERAAAEMIVEAYSDPLRHIIVRHRAVEAAVDTTQ